MKFESYQRSQPAINISALVDVLFILIVFVMLAANFDRVRTLDVALPTADSQVAVEPAAARLVLAGDTVTLNDAVVPAGELDAALRRARSEHDRLVVVADGQTALTRVTVILSAAQSAGFSSVAIATRPAGDPP